MYQMTSGWIDTSPPPPLRIDSTTMQGDHGNGYYFRSLIATAEMFGKTWYAVTFLSPHTRLPADARTTVFVGSGCDWLGISEDGERLAYTRSR